MCAYTNADVVWNKALQMSSSPSEINCKCSKIIHHFTSYIKWITASVFCLHYLTENKLCGHTQLSKWDFQVLATMNMQIYDQMGCDTVLSGTYGHCYKSNHVTVLFFKTMNYSLILTVNLLVHGLSFTLVSPPSLIIVLMLLSICCEEHFVGVCLTVVLAWFSF
jgi:hypothetical protein